MILFKIQYFLYKYDCPQFPSDWCEACIELMALMIDA